MWLTHAEESRSSTVCCVAGLLVVVALVFIRINFDSCWSSLSLSVISLSFRSLFFFLSSFFFVSTMQKQLSWKTCADLVSLEMKWA